MKTKAAPYEGEPYGFPKTLPPGWTDDSFDLKTWLMSEGYPKALVLKYSAENGVFRCKFQAEFVGDKR